MNEATHCCNGDCNQGRACPERPGRKHNCDELGVCQGGGRQDCDLPCTLPPPNPYPFAPGVIDGMPERRVEESLTWRLLDLAEWAVGIGMVAGTAGFVAAKMGWL